MYLTSPPHQIRELYLHPPGVFIRLCVRYIICYIKKKKALCIAGKSTAGSLVHFFFFLNHNDIFGFLQVPLSLADDARHFGRITADCWQSRQLQMQPVFPSSFHGSYTVSDFAMHFSRTFDTFGIYIARFFW